jgi:hypothetical protein
MYSKLSILERFWEWPKSFLNQDLSYFKHDKIPNYLYK